MRRIGIVLPGLAAMFVLAGGGIHLREWLETYRSVPAEVAGAVVVRAGFPANAAISLLVAGVLLYAGLRLQGRQRLLVVGGAIGFQLASAAVLIMTRYGNVLGWMESGWSSGATATLAVELAALGLLVLWLLRPRLVLASNQ